MSHPMPDSSHTNGTTNETSTTTTTTTISSSLVVSPLEENGITYEELEIAIKVLDAVADLQKNKSKKRPAPDDDDDGMTSTSTSNQRDPVITAYNHPNLRPLRKALAKCLTLHQRQMYEGKTQEEYLGTKLEEKRFKRLKQMDTQQQRHFIEHTALRKGRIERLREKQSQAEDEEQSKLQYYMIPDGHVETQMDDCDEKKTDTTTPKLLPPSSSSTTTTTTTTTTNESAVGKEEEKESTIKLPKLRSCYVCKDRFRDLHHFYDQLCPTCATLNWEKRHQTANLQGKVAVVTGSRVKIGYQTCLKLLRAGATVIATTRFPNAAASTYRKEIDFSHWKDRLQVYGLDLRDVTGLEAFCRFLVGKFCDTGIDILINNACQTIRRPTAYYLPTCEKEEELWKEADDTHKDLLGGCVQFEQIRQRLLIDQGLGGVDSQRRLPEASSSTNAQVSPECETTQESSDTTMEEVIPSQSTTNDNETALVTTVIGGEETSSVAPSFERTGISHSTTMAQMVLLPEDVGISDSILPRGLTDINNQQLDLRKTNSWLLKMEDVSTPEVMECMFINAIAPFVLNSRLKPLMSTPLPHADRYIINVSAMEGKFYRYKMPNHPHTNMAKAALNMMTRTSAPDLAKNHGIYMNSVDTGWINDENPLEKANLIAKKNHFQTPIDEIDAAARIVDPIFSGINHPESPKEYGKFLKDYRETEW